MHSPGADRTIASCYHFRFYCGSTGHQQEHMPALFCLISHLQEGRHEGRKQEDKQASHGWGQLLLLLPWDKFSGKVQKLRVNSGQKEGTPQGNELNLSRLR